MQPIPVAPRHPTSRARIAHPRAHACDTPATLPRQPAGNIGRQLRADNDRFDRASLSHLPCHGLAQLFRKGRGQFGRPLRKFGLVGRGDIGLYHEHDNTSCQYSHQTPSVLCHHVNALQAWAIHPFNVGVVLRPAPHLHDRHRHSLHVHRHPYRLHAVPHHHSSSSHDGHALFPAAPESTAPRHRASP